MKVSKEEVVKEMKLAFMLLNRRQLPSSRSPIIAGFEFKTKLLADLQPNFLPRLPARSAVLQSSAAALEKDLEANEHPPVLQLVCILPYEIPRSLCCFPHSFRSGISQHSMQSSLRHTSSSNVLGSIHLFNASPESIKDQRR
jgi:hypothetical protein